MLNALTIDVEDYYMVSAFADSIAPADWGRFESRVARNTERLLDILDRAGVRATCFVLGWVAERHPGIVREIRSRGHEIGCHSYGHRLVYDLGPEAFRADTRRAKSALEDVTGEAILGYRAPSYSITRRSLWAFDILAEEGFRYDSSVFPILHDRYGIPEHGRFPAKRDCNGSGGLLEIPLSTVRVLGRNLPIAGGGYLRLYPAAVTEWAIRMLNERERQAAIVYVHPWEIDCEQPRMRGSRLSVFRHYVNIATTATKLERLLGKFRFAPLKDVFGTYLRGDDAEKSDNERRARA